MSDWEDDDYDPSAQMADKIASLGLDDVIRKQKEAAAAAAANNAAGSAQQTEGGGGIAKKTNDKGAAGAKGPWIERELTEQEKREAQLRSDASAAMDLFGISTERKEPVYEELQSKADFLAFADKLGEQFSARNTDQNYLIFANQLIDHLAKPMSKTQLQTIKDTVQAHIDVYLKREESEQKKQTEQRKQKETKKAKSKQIHEDVVEDDYDDYDEKFHRY